MSQASDPPHDSEPDDVPAPAAADDRATRTRKTLWAIGAGVGIYLIARGLFDMYTGAS